MLSLLSPSWKLPQFWMMCKVEQRTHSLHGRRKWMASNGWEAKQKLTSKLKKCYGVVTVYTAQSRSPSKQVKEPKTLGTCFTWHIDSITEGGQWKSLLRSGPHPAVDEQHRTDSHHLCKFLVSQRCGWAFSNLTDPLRRHHGFCFYVFKESFVCKCVCLYIFLCSHAFYLVLILLLVF